MSPVDGNSEVTQRAVTMYTLMCNLGLRKAVLAEVPSLLVSMIAAELFYKFHSFLLGARPVRRARMRSEPGDMFRRSAVQALGSDEA